MWGLLPLKIRLAAIIVCGGLIATTRIALATQNVSLTTFIEALLWAAGILAIVGPLFGRLAFTWRIPCALGLRVWYPDLNGVWKGFAQSSFQERGERTNSRIEMTIEQRWTHIRVWVRSSDDYHSSKSISVIPAKEDRMVVLWTNFIGEQFAPRPTDERQFYGTSRLIYERSENRLRGHYWTDRASHVSGSGGTAGTISLSKKH
jgi:hypothetical protein